jgi:glucoamylase
MSKGVMMVRHMSESFSEQQAPGAPGILPNWCSGAKQMVGTSLGPSRVWFTIGKGILNEVYYPRIDIAQLRDLGFIIADDKGFWQEIKLLKDCEVTCAEIGVPAVTIVHRHPRFTFTQRIVNEPNRDVILIEISLHGDADLKPYVLLAPHLGGTGNHNFAEAGKFRGRSVLWAEQGPFGLALTAVDAQQQNVLGTCSAGYSGTSDGWQDFNRHGHLKMKYRQAGPGNVALIGGVSRQATLAIGFSSSRESAATLAFSSLLQPFDLIWQQQIDHWKQWHKNCHLPSLSEHKIPQALAEQVKVSAMVLRTHHDQTFRGALVASLSVPWGESTAERPGYHLVWPRDLVECAGALLALGSEVEAREILRYLMATQREDGSWYQNQWLGSKPFWTGIQLDQVAFPVLLAGTLAQRDALDGIEVTDMVQRALGFIACNGPLSPQDRWEENSGVNTFTMAVCLAALVAGADFLPTAEEAFVLELADYWNLRLDDWTAVYNTPFAKAQKVNGYYLRIMPSSALSDESVLMRAMPIKNRKTDPGLSPSEQIGVDFLQLVRYGLRDPNDPLVRDTLKLIDTLLRVELPQGPCWYRYTGDGYGEHSDGRAYDGTGHGRLWPLLTGERGHYELVRGADAMPYLQAMAAMAGEGGMLPEQVWDKDDIPEHGLALGRATGSAMPLAWAHAEYIKLACSIAEGRPVDRPEALWLRYHGKRPEVHIWYWSPQASLRHMPTGARLGFCLPQAAAVVWRFDNQTEQTLATHELSLGVHIAHLPEVDAKVSKIGFRLQGDDFDDVQHQVLIKS